MFRGLYLGFIRLHILYHASHEEIYGLAMMQELQRHGYDVSPGTLYPMLREMEEQGYLHRQDRVVGGKVRKYYTATDLGVQALAEARGKLDELASEVLDERTPRLPPTEHDHGMEDL